MRIKIDSDYKYSLFSRFMFWLQKRKFKKPLTPTLIWGRSSWLYLTFSLFNAAISRRSSPISSEIRLLVMTYVSQINECDFCTNLNSTRLGKLASPEKVCALEDIDTSNQFTEKERVSLQYTRAITRSDLKVDDDLFDRLKIHYSDNDIIELTAIISFQNLSSKFNNALDVPSDNLS